MNVFGYVATRLLPFGLLLTASLATGFEPQLSQSAIKEAVQAGANLANAKGGYKLQDWVLFGDEDPFVIRPDEGTVEAVVIGTPFERLRYQSYLQHYQGNELTMQEAQERASELENTVTFVVFAHSPGSGQEYQDFLENFGSATLQLAGDSELSPSNVETFGSAQDFYNIPGEASEFRYLGYVAYRFDLAPLAQEGRDISSLEGTLTFTDSTGREYSFEVNLGNYR